MKILPTEPRLRQLVRMLIAASVFAAMVVIGNQLI
jgi:hypothetical protein